VTSTSGNATLNGTHRDRNLAGTWMMMATRAGSGSALESGCPRVWSKSPCVSLEHRNASHPQHGHYRLADLMLTRVVPDASRESPSRVIASLTASRPSGAPVTRGRRSGIAH
jgi:hypothetical protein